MVRKISFTTGEYYHVYNRGVDKRDVFMCKSDFFRFLHSIKEFNGIQKPSYYFSSKSEFRFEMNNLPEVRPRANERLIDIICYCLMPNHFHFLLRQSRDGGVTEFMRRLMTGYTMYFNKKYERSGVLFQGVFKARHINDEGYLWELSRYIHLNPLEIGGNAEEYLWSSFRFYADKKKRCLFRLTRELIEAKFGNPQEYKKFVFSRPSFLDNSLKIDA